MHTPSFHNPPHFLFYSVLFTYFLPTIVGLIRRHTHAVGVFFVNLLLGWTFIGWVVAQVWSFTNDPAPAAGAKTPLGTKILGAVAVLYYILMFGFIVVSAHRNTAPPRDAQHAQMSTIPQNGVPRPASALLGK